MGLLDRVRKAAPQPSRPPAPPVAEPVLTWEVQFDKGGRTYTYQRTQAAFKEFLADRHLHGRDKPYRVDVVVDEKPTRVQIDIE